MSKKKKTLDELLEETLVTEDEQPYALPEGWVWVELNTLAESIQYGYTESASLEKIGPKFVRITDIQDNQVDWSKVPYCAIKENEFSKYRLDKNDILVARTGATTGKSYRIEEVENAVFASYLIRIRLNKLANASFIENYMKTHVYWNQIMLSKKGIAQPGANSKILGALKVPLPSKNEQEKIANKISILFDKIDEANQLIDEAKETFGLRRAGVLEAALKGELTTSFRKNEVVEDAHILYKKLKSEATFKAKINPDILESDIRHSIPSTWKWVKLGDVLKITSGGTPKKAFKEYYVDGKVPWIKTGEIKWNRISEAEEHITQLGVEKSSAKWLPKKSVLVAMYGQGLTRGRAAILDIEATCNQAVCALLPSPYITPEYLYYYFMEGYNRFRSIAKGGNQENLSATMISEFLLPLPPLKEQLKIVELLDEFFNKELQVKELLNINVDEIKSAVLSKAFKGELGTNDAADEPAIELLKSILQEKL